MEKDGRHWVCGAPQMLQQLNLRGKNVCEHSYLKGSSWLAPTFLVQEVAHSDGQFIPTLYI